MPMAQAAGNMRGGSAGGKADGLVLHDQFGASNADTPFVGGTMLLEILKKRIVAKWFIQERLDQGGAPRRAPDQSFELEFRQVSPNARGRSVQVFDQFFQRDIALAANFSQDAIDPVVVRHPFSPSARRSETADLAAG